MTAKSKSSRSFKQMLHEAIDKPIPPGIIVALLIVLAISGASVLLVNLFGGTDRFRGMVEGAGAWAPLVYIALKASTYVIAPLSGTPVKLVGGAVFGLWEGFAYALVGDVLGATINFWIARLFRIKGVVRFAGRKALKRIDETAEHVGGWRALLVGRLFFSSLYDFISYAAGLSSIAFKQFFIITVLGGIPWTFMSVWLGNAAFTNMPLFFGLFGIVAVILLANLFAAKSKSSKE